MSDTNGNILDLEEINLGIYVFANSYGEEVMYI